MNRQEPEPAAPDDLASGMPALAFMIGDWELDYTVTRNGSTTRTICGTGSIRRFLDAAYITFDYVMRQKATMEKIGAAHGIFAWDKKAGQYRFFWFESSGTFLQADGSLSADHPLALEWQGVNCRQVFRRVDAGAMYLEMRCPDEDLLLRVDFTRMTGAGPTPD
ncbi:MAG: DUF1579 family protein [Acidobacteria bacterium]|nr:DUF1579 family protein [Acidobacteriota bacterium]